MLLPTKLNGSPSSPPLSSLATVSLELPPLLDVSQSAATKSGAMSLSLTAEFNCDNERLNNRRNKQLGGFVLRTILSDERFQSESKEAAARLRSRRR
jgi:hypothetical protein